MCNRSKFLDDRGYDPHAPGMHRSTLLLSVISTLIAFKIATATPFHLIAWMFFAAGLSIGLYRLRCSLQVWNPLGFATSALAMFSAVFIFGAVYFL